MLATKCCWTVVIFVTFAWPSRGHNDPPLPEARRCDRPHRDFVAELSKEARAGLLGAQLERAVILLEILWNFENRVYPLYRRSHLRIAAAILNRNSPPTGGMAQIGRIARAR